MVLPKGSNYVLESSSVDGEWDIYNLAAGLYLYVRKPATFGKLVYKEGDVVAFRAPPPKTHQERQAEWASQSRKKEAEKGRKPTECDICCDDFCKCCCVCCFC